MADLFKQSFIKIIISTCRVGIVLVAVQCGPIGSTLLPAIYSLYISTGEKQAIKSPWEPRNKMVINLLPIYFSTIHHNKTLFRDIDLLRISPWERVSYRVASGGGTWLKPIHDYSRTRGWAPPFVGKYWYLCLIWWWYVNICLVLGLHQTPNQIDCHFIVIPAECQHPRERKTSFRNPW